LKIITNPITIIEYEMKKYGENRIQKTSIKPGTARRLSV
jgi:hypothetical protein